MRAVGFGRHQREGNESARTAQLLGKKESLGAA